MGLALLVLAVLVLGLIASTRASPPGDSAGMLQ